MAISKLTNDIILYAFYLIGEFSSQQPPPGYAINDGIYLLNSLIDNFMAEGTLIPYWSDIVFDLVAGQREYIVNPEGTGDVTSNKLQNLAFVTIEDSGVTNPVSYPVKIIGYQNLLDVVYTTTTQARPTEIILQNENEESRLIFHYIPDKAYTCRIKAKTQLDELQYQGILDELPAEYHRFLRYALARELSSMYQTKNWTDVLESEYQRMYTHIKGASDSDLTLNPELFLTSNSGYYSTNLGVMRS